MYSLYINCEIDIDMYSRCLQNVQKPIRGFGYEIGGRVEIMLKHTPKVLELYLDKFCSGKNYNKNSQQTKKSVFVNKRCRLALKEDLQYGPRFDATDHSARIQLL